MLDVTKVPSPCYVMEEDLLRKNLSLIKSVNIFITQQQVLNTKPDWLSKSLAARLIRILLLIQRPIFLLF